MNSDRDTGGRTTLTAQPSRSHALAACPSPAESATALAWELGEPDADRVEAALAELAPVVTGRTPRAQLLALGGAVRSGMLMAARATGPETLLLDRVLERGRGDRLALAIVLHEIGRRAGLPVGIVGGPAGHFVAHRRLTERLVLDPGTGCLVPAGALAWRCGHQIAAELLELLQPRYERSGDLTRALQIARLRCALPFDPAVEAEQRLRRVTARLN